MPFVPVEFPIAARAPTTATTRWADVAKDALDQTARAAQNTRRTATTTATTAATTTDATRRLDTTARIAVGDAAAARFSDHPAPRVDGATWFASTAGAGPRAGTEFQTAAATAAATISLTRVATSASAACPAPAMRTNPALSASGAEEGGECGSYHQLHCATYHRIGLSLVRKRIVGRKIIASGAHRLRETSSPARFIDC